MNAIELAPTAGVPVPVSIGYRIVRLIEPFAAVREELRTKTGSDTALAPQGSAAHYAIELLVLRPR